jgi:2,4-dienoyl-CoA reductase-like NADH-dependent reductase (Old Yellow Enzyme family)
MATCSSSFISPLTNQRTDEHGGSLHNRLRYPLAVFAAVRAAWPQDKPIVGAHLGQRLGRGRHHAG